MFSFQSSEFWILSLHTARFFIWHCWGILPSLQAALNLLADLLVKTTRSGELSPAKQRQLSSDLPNFCWLLICCHVLAVSVNLPWKSSHCYIFWGTQEAINTFFLTRVVTWGSLGYSGSRNPPLETLHGLGQCKICWYISWDKTAMFKTENLKFWVQDWSRSHF